MLRCSNIDSVAFNRQQAPIVKRRARHDIRGPEMLRLTEVGSAPEFEYEEGGDAWRTLLHGAYLHLAHSNATLALVREGRYSETIGVTAPCHAG